MARRAEYEGGAWSVGGVRSARPPVSPAVRRMVLLRLIEHASTRLDEGCKPYAGILRELRLELVGVSVQLATERATARRAAASRLGKAA